MDMEQRIKQLEKEVDKYYQLWQSVIAYHQNKTVQERDRLLVLATKYCPTDHPDWDEIMKIADKYNFSRG